MKYNSKYTVVDGQKWCRHCEVMKPVEEFSRNSQAPSGLQYWCKSCGAKRAKTYTRFSKYGINKAVYDILFQQQGGVCAICKTPPLNSYSLFIDHCHDTGKIRGLLCNRCNNGLGAFGDNAEGVRAALDYLAR